MDKAKLFFLFSLSFISGIFLASFYFPKTISLFFLWLLIALVIILESVFYKNRRIQLVGFLILLFFSGIFLTNLRFSKFTNLKNDQKIFTGKVIIVQEPQIKNRKQILIVKSKKIVGKILIQTGRYQDYYYGDELKIKCQLKTPTNNKTDFDYRMYLAKDEIFYQCQKTKIKKMNSNEGNIVYAQLIKIKNKFNEKIENLIPAPEAGLLSGLILGGTHNLSVEVKHNFAQTGLMHIVAVSGYNVTIIAEYLMMLGIFLGLWRQQAFWFSVVGIILFVTITGLSSSSVRAGIMGVLLIWAIKNGRLANSKNAILFAADLMLLINPLLLRWDTGFQLSFLASLGIIYLYPFFQTYLIKNHQVFGLAEILFLTISAQIFVLPLIILVFQKLSLISPLANLLILPIIPLTMLLGFLAVLGSFIFYPLALVLAWLAFLPLRYEMLVINFLASLKYSAINLKIVWWEVIGWYIILMGTITIIQIKRKNNQNVGEKDNLSRTI